MSLEFIDAAQDELDSAAAYYDGQRQGLGDEFRDEVRKATDRIAFDPTSLPVFSRNSRICRTKRFPYGVVFQVHEVQIRVISVMHLHRDPGYWLDRLDA